MLSKIYVIHRFSLLCFQITKFNSHFSVSLTLDPVKVPATKMRPFAISKAKRKFVRRMIHVFVQSTHENNFYIPNAWTSVRHLGWPYRITKALAHKLSADGNKPETMERGTDKKTHRRGVSEIKMVKDYLFYNNWNVRYTKQLIKDISLWQSPGLFFSVAMGRNRSTRKRRTCTIWWPHTILRGDTEIRTLVTLVGGKSVKIWVGQFGKKLTPSPPQKKSNNINTFVLGWEVCCKVMATIVY